MSGKWVVQNKSFSKEGFDAAFHRLIKQVRLRLIKMQLSRLYSGKNKNLTL